MIGTRIGVTQDIVAFLLEINTAPDPDLWQPTNIIVRPTQYAHNSLALN